MIISKLQNSAIVSRDPVYGCLVRAPSIVFSTAFNMPAPQTSSSGHPSPNLHQITSFTPRQSPPTSPKERACPSPSQLPPSDSDNLPDTLCKNDVIRIPQEMDAFFAFLSTVDTKALYRYWFPTQKTSTQTSHRTTLIPSSPCISQELRILQTCAALYPGSKFSGEQYSGQNTYKVSVTLQTVDMEESYITGYLEICGLTDEFPTLSTFFEAEVIGHRYSFATRRWDADDSVDRKHWTRFSEFSALFKNYEECDVKRYDWKSSDWVFMRWKERFLVQDHRIQHVNGASYDGFYYICYKRTNGEIQGYYYHQVVFNHILAC